MLRTRRPTQSIHFTPAVGLEFEIADDGGATVADGHLAERIVLSDRLRWVRSERESSAREFELLGRDDDIVKIAGKRASLSGLTQRLLAVPGVVDGVYFRMHEGDRRLCAMAVAPNHTLSSLRAALGLTVDSAFLPRPLL